jgi:hypothetical protein
MAIETVVTLVVKYGDGRSRRIKIKGSALDKHAAGVLAKNRQQVGELPKGKIKSVRRVPTG